MTIRKATDHDIESYEQTGVISKYHSNATKLLARKVTRDEVENAVEDLGAIMEETEDQDVVDKDLYNEQGYRNFIQSLGQQNAFETAVGSDVKQDVESLFQHVSNKIGKIALEPRPFLCDPNIELSDVRYANAVY